MSAEPAVVVHGLWVIPVLIWVQTCVTGYLLWLVLRAVKK